MSCLVMCTAVLISCIMGSPLVEENMDKEEYSGMLWTPLDPDGTNRIGDGRMKKSVGYIKWKQTEGKLY